MRDNLDMFEFIESSRLQKILAFKIAFSKLKDLVISEFKCLIILLMNKIVFCHLI